MSTFFKSLILTILRTLIRILQTIENTIQNSSDQFITTGAIAGLIVTGLSIYTILLPTTTQSSQITIPTTQPSPPLTEPSPPIIIEEPPPPIQTPQPKILSAPSNPVEVAISTPTPEPLPVNQNLIKIVQQQIDKLIQGYPIIIESTLINFSNSLLTIKITDTWYDLEPKEQDQLAQKIFQGIKKLDFSNLHIIDPRNRLVARNGLIGNDMIILNR